MTWLLILFGVAVVVSPLMWFRQSPRQKLITELRRAASSMGLQVSLHRRPDARDDETRLECVCYRLPWLDDSCRQNWVLQRYSNRGWDLIVHLLNPLLIVQGGSGPSPRPILIGVICLRKPLPIFLQA